MSNDFDQDDLDHMGPVDYLVIEFPGSKMTGEGLPMLVDLADRNIIRILDLVFARKLEDGSVIGLELGDLAGDEGHALAVFSGASSGLIGPVDIEEVGEVLDPGSSAAVLVYENVWAAPLARALRRAGGRLVAGGRIPVQSLLATLDDLESRDEQQRPQPTTTKG